MILLIAFLLGVIAGMRSLTPLAGVAWAGHSGRVSLAGHALSFLSGAAATWIVTLLALGELVADKLPKKPSRKTPVPFIGRIAVGAFCGATYGGMEDKAVLGAVAGIAGALVGTLGGAAFRTRLADAFGKDLPAAIIEDVMALGGCIVVLFVIA